jgi:hypothetical protein
MNALYLNRVLAAGYIYSEFHIPLTSLHNIFLSNEIITIFVDVDVIEEHGVEITTRIR